MGVLRLTGSRDGLRTASDGDDTGLDDLADSVRFEHAQQRVELGPRTGRLDGQRLGRDVDHLGAEQIHRLDDLGAHAGVGAHLDEHEFAGDGRLVLLLDDLDDVDELVELLGDLLERELVDGHHDRHPRDVGHLGATDGKGFDVEAASREQRCDSGEHARLVLDENTEGVARAHLVSSWAAAFSLRASSASMVSWMTAGSSAAASSSNSGRMSRAAMISSLLVPAATI